MKLYFQSIVPKKAEFQNIIDSAQPDIVVATKTWLKEGIHQHWEISEMGKFSSNYKKGEIEAMVMEGS